MKARFQIAERRKCIQRFYFQYQTEAMPKGMSIEQFCLKNKVPYNIFSKWYRDTRKKIVEVQVDGKPTKSEQQPTNPPEEGKSQMEKSSVRILVELRMTNGLHISQKNLSYLELRRLVEKLEGLC